METTLGVAASRRASGGHRRQGDMALPHSRLAEHQRRRSEQNTREIGGVEVCLCLFCVCCSRLINDCNLCKCSLIVFKQR